MIRRRVSAVLRLRDGFTGRVLPGGTVCLLDGRPLRHPLWKEGGYLVIQDLAAGPHSLEVRCAGFRPVTLTVEAGRTLWEEVVDLTPGEGYPFPAGTADLTIRFAGGGAPADGETVWVGMKGDVVLKLAQDKADPAETALRLFCQGPESRLPVPGHFILADPKAPELAALRSLRDGAGELEQPLAQTHPRGTEWVAARPCAVQSGAVQMRFAGPGQVWIFCRGALACTRVESGSQEYQWELGGGE